MPSSYSSSLRLELQFTGEGTNVWGDRNNGVISRLDSSIAGFTTKALAGNYTLTSANGSTDEARSAMLKFTGTAGTVTVPSVSKSYAAVWNATAGDVTLTTGAGATVTLGTGDKLPVFTDGSGVYGLTIAGQGIKAYVDGVAWTYNAGNLPAQASNAGKLLSTNGTTASWTNAIAAPVITGGVDQTGGTKGNVSALSGTDIDVTVGEYRTKTIASNTTFTFSGVTAGKWSAVVLELVTSSSAQPTFTGARWSSGSAPTLANGTHLIGLVYSGTAWTASIVASVIS